MAENDLSPSDLFVLTKDDVLFLRSLREEKEHRRVNPYGRPHVEDQIATTPEVYLAMTPAGGIPGLVTSPGTGSLEHVTAGSADCEMWRLQLWNNELSPLGFKKTVWNTSATAIAGATLILVVRDKFGAWVASQPGGGTFSYEVTDGTHTNTGSVGIEFVGASVSVGAGIDGTDLVTVAPLGSFDVKDTHGHDDPSSIGITFNGFVMVNGFGAANDTIGAAGSTTQVQYNDGTAMAASSSFTFNKSDGSILVGNLGTTNYAAIGKYSGQSVMGYFTETTQGSTVVLCDYGNKRGASVIGGYNGSVSCLVWLCTGTVATPGYAVEVKDGSIVTPGTANNTYRWAANVAAPSTSAYSAPTNIYGSSSTNILGDPVDWVLIDVNGTTRKIPVY